MKRTSLSISLGCSWSSCWSNNLLLSQFAELPHLHRSLLRFSVLFKCVASQQRCWHSAVETCRSAVSSILATPERCRSITSLLLLAVELVHWGRRSFHRSLVWTVWNFPTIWSLLLSICGIISSFYLNSWSLFNAELLKNKWTGYKSLSLSRFYLNLPYFSPYKLHLCA